MTKTNYDYHRGRYLYEMRTHTNMQEFPADLAGLNLWLDAADTPLGAVSSWLDKSGNGFNFTQGTGSAQPVNTANQQNGKSALVFDGNDALQAPAGALAVTQNNATIFAVASSSVDNAVERIVRYNGDTQAFGLSYSNVSGQVLYVHGTSVLGFSDVTKSNYNILCGRKAEAVLGFSVNNSSEQTSNNGQIFTANLGGSIGSTLGSSQFLTGGIAEIIIYSRLLLLSETQLVARYLSNKWGIAIA